MDVLKVGNKNYIKTNVIARELGYTADYVGQLCRNRKIESKLVGRSWYVDEASIREHKHTRYRSTQAKSLDAIKVEIHTIKEDLAAVKKMPTKSSFYSHSTQKSIAAYASDEADLLPKVGRVSVKTGSLDVELAEANKVSVGFESERYVFSTPKLPIIKFKGKLSVTEYDEGLKDLKEGETLLHPREVQEFSTKKRLQNKGISDKRELNKTETVREIVPTVLDLEEKLPAPASAPTPVRAIADLELEVEVSPLYKLSLAATVAVSFLFVVAVIGLETQVSFTSQAITTSYVFNIHNLVASVYNSH